MKRLALLAAILLAGLVLAVPAGAQTSSAEGVWLHPNGRVQVRIDPCGGQLCGTLIWFRRANSADDPRLIDSKNPDPALRHRPLIGLVILRDLHPTGPRTWDGGRIYDPDDGRDYRMTMRLQDDHTMRVRVFVLLPLLGETEIWTRVG